jgi:hypothetical protein
MGSGEVAAIVVTRPLELTSLLEEQRIQEEVEAESFTQP